MAVGDVDKSCWPQLWETVLCVSAAGGIPWISRACVIVAESNQSDDEGRVREERESQTGPMLLATTFTRTLGGEQSEGPEPLYTPQGNAPTCGRVGSFGRRAQLSTVRAAVFCQWSDPHCQDEAGDGAVDCMCSYATASPQRRPGLCWDWPLCAVYS